MLNFGIFRNWVKYLLNYLEVLVKKSAFIVVKFQFAVEQQVVAVVIGAAPFVIFKEDVVLVDAGRASQGKCRCGCDDADVSFDTFHNDVHFACECCRKGSKVF